MYQIFTTPPFKLLFPNLFTPTLPFPDVPARPKYRIGMAFDKEASLSDILNASIAESKKRFGKRTYYPRNVRKMLSTGEHSIYMAQTITKPVVQYQEEGKTFILDSASEAPVGSICTAELYVFSYAAYGREGVGLVLISVNKIGEPKIGNVELESIGLDIFEKE